MRIVTVVVLVCISLLAFGTHGSTRYQHEIHYNDESRGYDANSPGLLTRAGRAVMNAFGGSSTGHEDYGGYGRGYGGGYGRGEDVRDTVEDMREGRRAMSYAFHHSEEDEKQAEDAQRRGYDRDRDRQFQFRDDHGRWRESDDRDRDHDRDHDRDRDRDRDVGIIERSKEALGRAGEYARDLLTPSSRYNEYNRDYDQDRSRWGSGGDDMGSYARRARDKADDMGQYAKDKVKGARDSAKDKMEDMKYKAKSTYNDISDRTRQGIDTAKDYAEDATQRTGDQVRRVYDSTADMTKDAYYRVRDRVADTARMAADSLAGTTRQARDLTVDAARSTARAAGGVALSASHSFMNMATNAAQALKDVFSRGWEGTKDAVVNAKDRMGHAVSTSYRDRFGWSIDEQKEANLELQVALKLMDKGKRLMHQVWSDECHGRTCTEEDRIHKVREAKQLYAQGVHRAENLLRRRLPEEVAYSLERGVRAARRALFEAQDLFNNMTSPSQHGKHWIRPERHMIHNYATQDEL